MTRRGNTIVVVLCLIALGVALNSAALVVLYTGQQRLVDQNCRSINTVVKAGQRILDTPRNLRTAYDRGQVTREQYERGLAQIHAYDPLRQQNLKYWRQGACNP